MNRSDEPELLSRRYLQENFHDTGFGYLLPELLELFTQQTRSYLSALHQLHRTGDLQALAAEAHGLKGTAGSVGAAALAKAAADLEQAVLDDSHTPDLISRLVQDILKLGPETLAAAAAERARLIADDESMNFFDP